MMGWMKGSGALAVAWLAFAGVAQAAAYDDAANDLSDTPATPTPWTLELGANTLTGAAGSGTDFDLVAITASPPMQRNRWTRRIVLGQLSRVMLEPGDT